MLFSFYYPIGGVRDPNSQPPNGASEDRASHIEVLGKRAIQRKEDAVPQEWAVTPMTAICRASRLVTHDGVGIRSAR
jgi:hypothetical protein